MATGRTIPTTLRTSQREQRDTVPAATTRSQTHPFTAYLQIVSFTATITISVSISASQGFATAGTFLGIPVDRTSTTNLLEAIAVHQTTNAAKWLSWSAAVSSLSLIITLILQLFFTDELFVQRVTARKAGSGFNVFMFAVAAGSWIALMLQGAALAFIGQGLKAVNNASGTVIQCCLAVVGGLAIVVYIFLRRQWVNW